MAADLAAFRARFPEFDPTLFPDNQVNAVLNDAVLNVNRDVWAERADMGTLYFAAHLLATSGTALGGTGAGVALGPVLSETVGDISRTYASIFTGDSAAFDLALTKYGLAFLRLESGIPATPMVL